MLGRKPKDDCIPNLEDDICWCIAIGALDYARQQQQFANYDGLVRASECQLKHNHFNAYPDQIQDQIRRLVYDGYLLDVSEYNFDETAREQTTIDESKPRPKTFAPISNLLFISKKGIKALDQMLEMAKPAQAKQSMMNRKISQFYHCINSDRYRAYCILSRGNIHRC